MLHEGNKRVTKMRGSLRFTGRIEVYGATQIPVPGFKPDPLTVIPVEKRKNVFIDTGHIRGIPDSAWPWGSVDGDSIYRFNLVASNAEKAAILTGFAFLRIQDSLISSDTAMPGSMQSDEVDRIASLEDLVPAETFIKIDQEWLIQQDHFIFILGTGYIARNDSLGNFSFAKLPFGHYPLRGIRLWQPGKGPASNSDSTALYSLKGGIETSRKDTLVFESTFQIIPKPTGVEQ